MGFLKLCGWIGFGALVIHFVSAMSEPSDPPAAVITTASPAQAIASIDVVRDSGDADNAEDEEVSYQCYSSVSEPLGALIMEIKACDVEDALLGRDIRALSILPANGFKDGVAGVFKKHQLHINQNAEVMCSDHPAPTISKTPGCSISIYVSRVRASGKYSDLAGWQAIWFRSVGEKTFTPINKVAGYLTKAEPWFLKSGGMLDNEDRP